MRYKDGSFERDVGIEPIFFDIETTGLNPMDSRIVAVGIGWFSIDGPKVEVISTNSEYYLCEQVREFARQKIDAIESGRNAIGVDVGEGEETFIVSNYGRKFDHPFYVSRCAGVYRQNPYPFGYRKMRLDISRVDGYYGSQDDMVDSRGINVGPEDTITGKDVPVLWDDGEVETIRNHCRSDVLEMMEMYRLDEQTMLEEVSDHYDL